MTTRIEAETEAERREREILKDFAPRLLAAGRGYREFTAMMERRMNRFTNDVVAALAASRTSFENGVLTIRQLGEPDAVIDLNGLGLRIARGEPDAGVAHNEAVLAMLRDLGPEQAPRKRADDVVLDDDPLDDAFLQDLQKALPTPGSDVVDDGRTLALNFSSDRNPTAIESVNERLGYLRSALDGVLSTWTHADAYRIAKADRYVLYAGQRFREKVLDHPDVAKAPYGRVAFNAASGIFTILGDVEVVGDESFPPTEARMVAVVDGTEQGWGFRLFVMESGISMMDDPHRREADPAIDRAIHTRDWTR